MPKINDPLRKKVRTGIKVFILVVFILGNILNLDTGWADNGDFYRVMKQYSSNPVGFHYWPSADEHKFKERFFNFYLPYFKLDYPFESEMFISAEILWLPGILLNQYFFSPDTLWMPLLSLGARFALFAFLWFFLTALERHTHYPEIFMLTAGLPLALLFSTSSIAAYFNTFYQETGSIVFLPILLTVIMRSHLAPRNAAFYIFYTLSILLAATSKSSFFYLPLLTVPFVISFEQIRQKPFVFVPLGLALVILPMLASLNWTHVEVSGPVRPYNSMITGVLQLSERPREHLADLGVPEAVECINKDAYTAVGRACYEKYVSTGIWDYTNTILIILREPRIIYKQLDLLTHSIHNLANEETHGRYVIDDPVQTRYVNRLDLWRTLQYRFFPRGWALAIFMVFSAWILFWSQRKGQLPKAVAMTGWLCLICFWADLFVQILGDGQRDLLKHMLVANLFFDFLLIAVINAPLLVFSEKIAAKRSTLAAGNL